MADKGKKGGKGKGGDSKKLISRLYEEKDGKASRTNAVCPKCGPGTFLAPHKDRAHCGRCGYTEFKKA